MKRNILVFNRSIGSIGFKNDQLPIKLASLKTLQSTSFSEKILLLDLDRRKCWYKNNELKVVKAAQKR